MDPDVVVGQRPMEVGDGDPGHVAIRQPLAGSTGQERNRLDVAGGRTPRHRAEPDPGGHDTPGIAPRKKSAGRTSSRWGSWQVNSGQAGTTRSID